MRTRDRPEVLQSVCKAAPGAAVFCNGLYRGRACAGRPLRSARAARIEDRDAALPDFGRGAATVLAQVGPRPGALALVLFPLLVVAPPLFGQRLLLALPGFPLGLLALLRFAPGLFVALRAQRLRLALGCPPGLFLALGTLLTQRLGIAVGGLARLLHPLGMRFAPGLFVAPGLLLAPGLFSAARELFAQDVLTLCSLGLARLLRTAGLLLAPGWFDAFGELLAPGLLRVPGRRVAPGLFGPLRLPARRRPNASGLLAVGLLGPRDGLPGARDRLLRTRSGFAALGLAAALRTVRCRRLRGGSH